MLDMEMQRVLVEDYNWMESNVEVYDMAWKAFAYGSIKGDV